MAVTILSPEGTVGMSHHVLAPSRSTLEGARLSVLGNRKPNAAELMLGATRALADRTGTRQPVLVEKNSAAEAAADTLIDELAASADLVVTGSAD